MKLVSLQYFQVKLKDHLTHILQHLNSSASVLLKFFNLIIFYTFFVLQVQGRKIGVDISLDKCSLYFGNLKKGQFHKSCKHAIVYQLVSCKDISFIPLVKLNFLNKSTSVFLKEISLLQASIHFHLWACSLYLFIRNDKI